MLKVCVSAVASAAILTALLAGGCSCSEPKKEGGAPTRQTTVALGLKGEYGTHREKWPTGVPVARLFQDPTSIGRGPSRTSLVAQVLEQAVLLRTGPDL
jgi:hypothetical protein